MHDDFYTCKYRVHECIHTYAHKHTRMRFLPPERSCAEAALILYLLNAKRKTNWPKLKLPRSLCATSAVLPSRDYCSRAARGRAALSLSLSRRIVKETTNCHNNRCSRERTINHNTERYIFFDAVTIIIIARARRGYSYVRRVWSSCSNSCIHIGTQNSRRFRNALQSRGSLVNVCVYGVRISIIRYLRGQKEVDRTSKSAQIYDCRSVQRSNICTGVAASCSYNTTT
uniref:Uncharacterized protein n=1 Tax=Trichogramma kaykai TaxID=54128 RepID=A0ABD2VVR5_9HYME